MQRDLNIPGTNQEGKKGGASYDKPPIRTPDREGGDDALANTEPTDARADEKVIVNEQRENKTINGPSQTAVNTSENAGSENDVVNTG